MNKEYNNLNEVSFEIENTPDIECFSLSNVHTQNVNWIWKKRIPKGTLTIVEGDGGKGKSTIIADLCARLSVGQKLPDDDQERSPMKVLLLSREDDPSVVLRPRLERHGANLYNIYFNNEEILLCEEGLNRLRNTIRQKKIDLVVIDPIVAFLGNKIDMNKSNNVRSVLGPLIDMAQDFGCTFIVVRHFNKMRGGPLSHRGAGSVDFRNAARSVLQILQHPIEDQHYLTVDKSNYGAMAKPLPFKIQDNLITWGEPLDLKFDDLAENALKPALDEAIAFLKEELKTPKPSREILKAACDAGISESTLRRARYALNIKPKKLKDHWQWALPTPKK